MGESHLFPGKLVNMIIASRIISEHFSNNITELSKERTNWTPAYATGLRTRVDTVAGNFLGIRTRDELFDATKVLMNLLTPAREKLAMIKTQIKVDFKKDPDSLNRILTRLGFSVSSHHHATQAEFVAMLVTFKRNLTPELTAEITAGGMQASLLTDVADMVDSIDKANTTQETLKGTTKEATDHVIRELNNLYEELIGICKIAYKHFKGNQTKKELFTYSRILRNLGDHAASDDDDDDDGKEEKPDKS